MSARFTRIVSSLVLALLAVTGLASCDRRGSASHDWPDPAPVLWQITAPDGARGWLFGTVHALPADVVWRTPVLDQALAAAGVVLVEIADPGSAERDKVFRTMAQTPAQPPLLDRVPPQDRTALANLMQRAGYTNTDFRDIETWAAALMLGNAVRVGTSANGVDRALIAEAAQVEELEGLQAQLRLFDTLPEARQAALLAAVARESEQADPHESLTLWLTGGLDTLYRHAVEGEGILADPHLHEALLAARNRRWLPVIAAAIDAGRAPMVAVGALHLPGDAGLAGLLEDAGYTLTRIQ